MDESEAQGQFLRSQLAYPGMLIRFHLMLMMLFASVGFQTAKQLLMAMKLTLMSIAVKSAVI